MIKILKRIKDKLNFKQDLPPPYRENEVVHVENRETFRQIDQQIEVFDLLANCNIEAINSDTDVEYAEIREDMGIWHSTPLSKRHKSKISLTWVLKENLENTRPIPEASKEAFNKYHHHIKLIENERRRVKSKERIVGRNEHYHLRPNDISHRYQSEHNLKQSENRSRSLSRRSEYEMQRPNNHNDIYNKGREVMDPTRLTQRAKYHNNNDIYIKSLSGREVADTTRPKYHNDNDIYIKSLSGREVADTTRPKYHNDNDIYIKSLSGREVADTTRPKYHNDNDIYIKSLSGREVADTTRPKYHNDNDIYIKSLSGREVADPTRPKYHIDNDIHTKTLSGRDVTDSTRSAQRAKYHNDNDMYAKSQSVRDLMVQSCSEDTSGEEFKKRQKHRHKKKKRRPNGKFGYDIRDLDSFLSEASIDRPGNIPVVIAYPTSLYQTNDGRQHELRLPLGTVANAVFKSKQWVYVQTPHGEEGYVGYGACLPLGILPSRTPQKKTPCWESNTDIYPRPCGNLTDNEKEQLRGRSKSECKYRPIRDKRRNYAKSCAEQQFDDLYLKTKSYQSIDKLYDDVSVKRKSSLKKVEVRRQMLLVVNQDFKGSDFDRTLSVKQGEVVVLVEKRGNDDWFYVKNRDGFEGFIPASVAGNGYI